jgi:hypothetical protein
MATASPFLTASWRHLAMLTWEVPRGVLSPLVPPGTELDDLDGAILATLVGFRFLDTRVLGLPVPGHRDFDEVNLRFYVRRRAEGGEWRHGVVFVREFVPRCAIALVARWLYNEPYTAVPMRHELEVRGTAEGGPGGAAFLWWLGGRWHRLEVQVASRPEVPAPGSEGEFVTRRHWGYTAERDGGCLEYAVEHPPWRVWRAASSALDCDVRTVYGEAFAESLGTPPRSALLADGSPVTVHRGHRLPR